MQAAQDWACSDEPDPLDRAFGYHCNNGFKLLAEELQKQSNAGLIPSGLLKYRNPIFAMAKIAIIVGHPQNQTLCDGLAEAYERGAKGAGHEVKLFALSRLKFDPILRGGYRELQPLEPDLQAAYDWMAVSDHWVLVFPLWCGDMPALLKGFIERILQPELMRRRGTDQEMNWRIFPEKSARVIMTMGMPTLFYRFWYGANTIRLLKRNILHFIGVRPVRHSLYGMVAEVSTDKRLAWLKEVEALGTAAM